MKLYSIFMTFITTIAVLIAFTFEDIYVSLVIFGLLSVVAIPVSDQYQIKENQ
ncbi:hypothetical protein ACP2XH_04635 [Staphylococcus epidermidis]